VTHLKHYGIGPHLKITVHHQCESCLYRKSSWFRSVDANNEEIQNILTEGLETYRIVGDPTDAAGLPCNIQRNFIATVGRYVHVQLSSYSTN